MSIRLVYGDSEAWAELPLEPDVEDRVYRILSMDDHAVERRRFAQVVVAGITSFFEDVPQPPTEKQVQYAVQIARTLNIPLAPDVLQVRQSMAVFLEENAPEYRRRKSLERGYQAYQR